MAHRPAAHPSTVRATLTATALVLLAAGCSRGSSVGNASPRIAPIPLQVTGGGAPVALDLSTWVTDRENGALVYAVLGGGGAFAGSTYSHTFPAMGQYEVGFTVTDDAANVTAGSFDVHVTASNFAVVNQDATGLMLLDTDTGQMIDCAVGAAAPAFRAGLADGRLVYQRGTGVAAKLSVFDPFTRVTRHVAPNATHVTWRATTPAGRIVFTTGPAADTDLYLHDPRTNLTTELSAAAGEVDGNAMVTAQELVFFERGSGGQRDVFFHDAETGQTLAIGADANDEQLRGVLADGGAVFSRVGAGGEQDLFWFRRDTGLAEVGANTPALATQQKTFHGSGSAGQVVFSALNGADRELWSWDPATGVATPIATGADHSFHGIGEGNEVVYGVEVSGSERDLFFHDLDDGTAATVRNAADLSVLLALTTDGTTAWAAVQSATVPTSVTMVSLVAAPASQGFGPGGTVGLGGLLQNGDLVAQLADGTQIARFDVSAGTWGAAIVGTGQAFRGDGVDEGDFVYSQSVAAQEDLSMWDESAAAPVAVSSAPGDDAFQCRSLSGTLLFTRVIAGNANADLFEWEQVAGETQLTDMDGLGVRHDHSVGGTYAGSR